MSSMNSAGVTSLNLYAETYIAGSNKYGGISIYGDATQSSSEDGTDYSISNPSAFRSAIGVFTTATMSDISSGSSGNMFIQI